MSTIQSLILNKQEAERKMEIAIQKILSDFQELTGFTNVSISIDLVDTQRISQQYPVTFVNKVTIGLNL